MQILDLREGMHKSPRRLRRGLFFGSNFDSMFRTPELKSMKASNTPQMQYMTRIGDKKPGVKLMLSPAMRQCDLLMACSP
jgi:hypothetical protein